MENFFNKLQIGWYINNEDAFKVDSLTVLCEVYNIDPNHPKLDKMFDLACFLGRPFGHYEVWLYMKELVDLIR